MKRIDTLGSSKIEVGPSPDGDFLRLSIIDKYGAPTTVALSGEGRLDLIAALARVAVQAKP